MNIPYVMKKCTCCGRWLVASTVNFHKQKGSKYGLRSKCKECRKNKHNPVNTGPSITKVCTTCGREFPATEEYFYRSKTGKYALKAICKECSDNKNRARNNPVNTDPNITRICTTCGKKFPATTEYFGKIKNGKYGLKAECRECHNNRSRAKNNPVNTDESILQRCTKCGKRLPATLEYFHRAKKGKYGLANECKECAAERNRQYCQEHKDKVAEYSSQYYQEHKDETAEYYRQWRKNNPDKMAEYSKRQSKKRRQARIDAIIAQKRAEYEAERAPLVAEKTCRCCGRTLPASEFYANKQTKDHLGSYCKECHKNKKQETYYHNLETKGWA